MTDVLKHRFLSSKIDGADTTQIQPSHWNDGHRFQGGATGDILQRDTADLTFGAQWAPTAWVQPPFVASDYFVSIGTGTWTVAAVDVVSCAYFILGRTLFWELGINGGAVTTTGAPIAVSRKPFSAHQIAHVSVGIYLLSPNLSGYYQVGIGAGSQLNFFRDILGTPWPSPSRPEFRASGFYEIVP